MHGPIPKVRSVTDCGEEVEKWPKNGHVVYERPLKLGCYTSSYLALFAHTPDGLIARHYDVYLNELSYILFGHVRNTTNTIFFLFRTSSFIFNLLRVDINTYQYIYVNAGCRRMPHSRLNQIQDLLYRFFEFSLCAALNFGIRNNFCSQVKGPFLNSGLVRFREKRMQSS